MKDQILAYLKARASASGKDLREHLQISRQALNVHLQTLITTRQVVKSGSTRGARYYAARRAPKAAIFTRRPVLSGLDEGSVYEQLATTLNLRHELSTHAERILHYAFTEMLNNAIDHSLAHKAGVSARLDTGTISFEIVDRGIGTFHSIASKFGLTDEHEAMIELLKGRTTTKPEAHSGEGLFFTSRAADRFVLRSHRIQLEWDRQRNDTFVSEPRVNRGTTVEFLLRRDTRRKLEDVFSAYAREEFDFQFEKTSVQVKLLRPDYVSRSEAKRLLINLEKFQEVELDFKGVTSVGQGFTDEIFRVFASRFPTTRIQPANAGPGVAAMIRHVSGLSGPDLKR